MQKAMIAIDLGASSGRVMAAQRNDGVQLTEIHRFDNGGTEADGVLRWDFTELIRQIEIGLAKAAARYEITSIGIDTWGLDFGLLDGDGNLLEEPVHYRDRRTEGVAQEVDAIVGRFERYSRTGIQFLRFNTVYQLFYLSRYRQRLWEKTDKILLIPDLIAYHLTGKMRLERTNASTTDLLHAATGEIDTELMRALGIKNVFCPLIEPGEAYGVVKADLAARLAIPAVPVVAVCTHDTASAVAALPKANDKPVAFISSGTWSLLGTELSDPILTEQSHKANFTNEVGYGRTIRYLKNIMGLWILQQIRARYKANGIEIGFAEMERMAADTPPTGRFVDVNDPSFDSPGDMLARIDAYLTKTKQRPLASDGERIRCVYESLAFCYKKEFDALSRITRTEFSALHIFGGGIQAKLLSSLTAAALSVPVVCGVKEATATGNALVQMLASGQIPSLNAARKKLAESEEIFTATPVDEAYMQANYERYLAVIQGEIL